jgi:hypothetical protein
LGLKLLQQFSLRIICRRQQSHQEQQTSMKSPKPLKFYLPPVSQGATIAITLACLAFGMVTRAADGQLPSLPSPLCDSLQVPEGHSLKFRAFAIGVQIYRWDGTAWVFVAPSAKLYSDPGFHGQIGIHYAGPTWESRSGSKVVGTRLAGCTPDGSAIPWLKLGAVSTEGPGVFKGVTFIHRVNTTAGTAPTTPGTTVGQLANVDYTAEYYFYSESD